VGLTGQKKVPTFADEWAKVKAGKPSQLFASDQIYGVHQSPRHYSKSTAPTRRTSFTPQQKSHSQAVYHSSSSPVWSEYSGQSGSRRYTYSPAVAKAQHDIAMQAFKSAEYVLSKARSKEW